ncbi:MAG: hypothetical protein P1U54_08385 [Immundisolibacteraceae bacterium]|nr:hypothetical protein [Immundisolibacteraceae bacterium]
MMVLSRFNATGIDRFQAMLQEMREGITYESPLSIIGDESLIEKIPAKASLDTKTFSSRGEMAGYLNRILSTAEIPDDMADDGLWAWLSAFYIDTVCPFDESGMRVPLADYRYVPKGSFRYFYRHLIRGPIRIFRIFEQNPDLAAIVMHQQVSKPGDTVEQLASRQERLTNPAVIATANYLYFDPKNNCLKKGIAPNWHKPGSLRRYLSVLDQLDMTYDLYSMEMDDILELLPEEFLAYQ